MSEYTVEVDYRVLARIIAGEHQVCPTSDGKHLVRVMCAPRFSEEDLESVRVGKPIIEALRSLRP